MKTIAIAFIVAFSLPLAAQSSNSNKTIISSGETSLIRVMNPSEKIAINGRVVRVGDLLPVLSSGSASEQHLRIPENHSRETIPQARQSEPVNQDHQQPVKVVPPAPAEKPSGSTNPNR